MGLCDNLLRGIYAYGWENQHPFNSVPSCQSFRAMTLWRNPNQVRVKLAHSPSHPLPKSSPQFRTVKYYNYHRRGNWP